MESMREELGEGIALLPFEKGLEGIVKRIDSLKHDGVEHDPEELNKALREFDRKLRKIYANLSPWERVQVARHPDRPHFKNFCSALLTEYVPLAGDRLFAEDSALLCGVGRLNGRSVLAMGHEKGYGTAGRIDHHFGMAKPEGYRKVVRLLELATRFKLPVIFFIDTPGAYPGKGAEERGQSEAIASSILACLSAPVPLLSVVTGEGCSGGAIAVGAADHVIMFSNATYSVISPEGAASILYRDVGKAEAMAKAMRMTAEDLLSAGFVDEILEEPEGGAHRHKDVVVGNLRKMIGNFLERYADFDEALVEKRRAKYTAMGL